MFLIFNSTEPIVILLTCVLFIVIAFFEPRFYVKTFKEWDKREYKTISFVSVTIMGIINYFLFLRYGAGAHYVIFTYFIRAVIVYFLYMRMYPDRKNISKARWAYVYTHLKLFFILSVVDAVFSILVSIEIYKMYEWVFINICAFPGSPIIYYKIAIFTTLMVMAFFEARFYIDEHNLHNKKELYLISFISNTVICLALFIPVSWFDLLVFSLYFVRSIFVGKEFIKRNKKRTYEEAKTSYYLTLPKNLMVMVGYNFIFFSVALLIGFVQGVMSGI